MNNSNELFSLKCEGLSLIDTKTEPSYWRQSPESLSVYECPKPKACPGGDAASCSTGIFSNV